MLEKFVSIFVIRRDLVQMKRVKCEVCSVERCTRSINYKIMRDMRNVKLIYLLLII
jgi:hypothetical protein